MDGDRFARVLWKIVRGLFFERMHNRYLPESTPRYIQLYGPLDPCPELIIALMGESSHGEHADVFDFKYRDADGDGIPHAWLLCFWERVIGAIFFHDPQCRCPACRMTTTS